jgi:hypothetical protein
VELVFAVIGIICLSIWIITGRKLVKNPKTSPHWGALWMSGWLGVTLFVLAFVIGGWSEQSFCLGMCCLINTSGFGYLIAFYYFQSLHK